MADVADPAAMKHSSDFKMGGKGIADLWAPPPEPTEEELEQQRLLEEKREKAIAEREAARKKKVENIKKSKFQKNLERQAAEEKAAAARKVEEERQAKLAEIEAKRQANIERKERERKEKAAELKRRKELMRTSKTYASQAEVLRIKELYDACDLDGNGKVQLSEIETKLRGSTMAWLADGLAQHKSARSDPTIDLPELLRVVYPNASAEDMELMLIWTELPAQPPSPIRRPTAKQLGEVHGLFARFDKDGEAGLSVSELRGALKATSLQMEDEELNKIFASFDADGSGLIDRKEFTALMLKHGLWDGTSGRAA